jgi:hypothetical protein
VPFWSILAILAILANFGQFQCHIESKVCGVIADSRFEPRPHRTISEMLITRPRGICDDDCGIDQKYIVDFFFLA